jgi:hypothetical protein
MNKHNLEERLINFALFVIEIAETELKNDQKPNTKS